MDRRFEPLNPDSRRALLVIAGVALLLSLASFWGSMHTNRLSRVPGAYTDNVQMWAYFQFLLSGMFGATAIVALLKTLSPTGKTVAVLMGLVAAFASVLAMYGLMAMIAVLAGSHNIYQGAAVSILVVVIGVSLAIYWWIVRGAGVGLAGSLAGAAAVPAFAPLLFLGAIFFCGAFTPNIRCL